MNVPFESSLYVEKKPIGIYYYERLNKVACFIATIKVCLSQWAIPGVDCKIGMPYEAREIVVCHR